MKLQNDAHERFCQEYMVDLNATAAYRRAYPKSSLKAAEVGGHRLLRNHKVAGRVVALQEERGKRTQVTADMVITELARIGFSDMRSFSEWGGGGVTLKDSGGLTEDEARCVAEVAETTSKDGGSLRFKLHDKVGALVKLGQHLGIRFVERHEHTGKDGAPLPAPRVTVYIPDNGRAPAIQPNGRVGANGHRPR